MFAMFCIWHNMFILLGNVELSFIHWSVNSMGYFYSLIFHWLNFPYYLPVAHTKYKTVNHWTRSLRELFLVNSSHCSEMTYGKHYHYFFLTENSSISFINVRLLTLKPKRLSYFVFLGTIIWVTNHKKKKIIYFSKNLFLKNILSSFSKRMMKHVFLFYIYKWHFKFTFVIPS